MSDVFQRLLLGALLAVAAVLAAGCDSHSDTNVAATLQDASSVVAKRGEDAVGTDRSVEDTALTTKVRAAILADPELKSQPIVVETDDAAVTLTGTVDSTSRRDRAVELAGSVDGVAQVQDRLEVRN